MNGNADARPVAPDVLVNDKINRSFLSGAKWVGCFTNATTEIVVRTTICLITLGCVINAAASPMPKNSSLSVSLRFGDAPRILNGRIAAGFFPAKFVLPVELLQPVATVLPSSNSHQN